MKKKSFSRKYIIKIKWYISGENRLTHINFPIIEEMNEKSSNSCLGLKIVAFSAFLDKENNHICLGLKKVANSCLLVVCGITVLKHTLSKNCSK